MATLSTAAWVAHDLGLAVGVGGNLFGRVALEPSVRNITDEEERGSVINDAWRRFGAVQIGALSLMAATWFAGRTRLSGREVDSTSRKLVLAKDILVGTTLASAIGAAVAGRKLGAQGPNGAVPVDETGDVAEDAPDMTRRLNAITNTFGLVNLVAGAALAAVTTILAMRAGESTRWSFVSRFLP